MATNSRRDRQASGFSDERLCAAGHHPAPVMIHFEIIRDHRTNARRFTLIEIDPEEFSIARADLLGQHIGLRERDDGGGEREKDHWYILAVLR
jgi:hypothetical protein